MNKVLMEKWRANFFTGLAIALPGIVSIAILVWLFSTASRVTDTLLFFLPQELTHESEGKGPIYWYWSVVALLLAVALISLLGLIARYYMGKKLIESVDTSLLRVPLLNKIYGTTKQVNEAFTSSGKNSFKTVAMVEFPRAGMYSVGFMTSEVVGEIHQRTQEKLVCVFIPTTPNPTSGFLVMVPEDQVTKLDMSVSDGLKFIISLGAISPEYAAAARKMEAGK